MAASRRLAAILAADVAGYSRLIGADEEGTLARLKAHRREVIDPKIGEHKGRIVKTTGDGLLVEFGSVIDALRWPVMWITASCAREETPERRGMPRLFLNTERGFGGKPPKKSGFRRHLVGSKMPKEGSKMPKKTFFTAISRWRVG